MARVTDARGGGHLTDLTPSVTAGSRRSVTRVDDHRQLDADIDHLTEDYRPDY